MQYGVHLARYMAMAYARARVCDHVTTRDHDHELTMTHTQIPIYLRFLARSELCNYHIPDCGHLN